MADNLLQPTPSPNESASSSASTTQSPASGGDQVRLVFYTLRRCWVWAVPLGCLFGLIAAYAVYYFFTPVFQASHLLESNGDYVVFRGTMPSSANLAASERQLIYTDLVLESVVLDPDILALLEAESTDEAKVKLREGLRVEGAGTNSMFKISFQDQVPSTASAVCNKIAESYLLQRERLESERIANLESWLAPSIDQWKEEVENHENRVRDLSKTSLGYDPTVRIEGLENDLSVLGTLRHDLKNLIVEESIMEAKVDMASTEKSLTDMDSRTPVVAEPTPTQIKIYLNSDRETTKARALLAEKEREVRAMESAGLETVRQDTFEKLKKSVTTAEQALATLEEQKTQEATTELKNQAIALATRQREAQTQERKEKDRLELDSLKRKLAEMKAQRAIVQNEYDLEKSRLETQGGVTADLLFAEEDRAVAVGILSQLNERLAAVRTETRRGSGVQSLAAATVPLEPISGTPLKKMLAAAGACFLLPFLLSFLVEFRSQRLGDATALSSQPIAPILGEIARIPTKSGASNKQRVFEESIDTLRANLMLSKETAGVRTIAIASSVSGEGKSSVASQLAISLAKACGETVLLVDADLRSPDQHDIFGLHMGEGLSRVLQGDAQLIDTVDKSLGDFVHVLPAGHLDMSPHRVLNPEALDALISTARDKYRFIVIDTAPVLAAGETLAVASKTDATLVCVMRDLSRADAVVRTTRRLEAAGANVIGTVFSGVPTRQYSYRYGQYYKYLGNAT
ncbi:MAG: polysaccharide biosynthesis tyrosine autokinase [Pirellulales bacterium]